jgi:hypothetical protein
MRDPIELPKSLEFGQFLATSLAFTKSLKKISVFVDGDQTHKFDKKVSEGRDLEVNRKEYTPNSSQHLFQLETVQVKQVQVSIGMNRILSVHKKLIFLKKKITDGCLL